MRHQEAFQRGVISSNTGVPCGRPRRSADWMNHHVVAIAHHTGVATPVPSRLWVVTLMYLPGIMLVSRLLVRLPDTGQPPPLTLTSSGQSGTSGPRRVSSMMTVLSDWGATVPPQAPQG
jgi:hypothetical protein